MVAHYSQKELTVIESSLGLEFNDITLLGQALVHRSALGDSPELFADSNQRFEFLGDAVLNLAVAHELVDRYPDWSDGRLTQVRSSLVNNESLARIARTLRLSAWLLMGKGDRIKGENSNPSVLADALESLFGALFLDRGYRATRDFAVRVMGDDLEVDSNSVEVHPKSHLIEAAGKRGYPPPRYRTVDKRGPNNNPTFTVQVVVNGKVLGTGHGRNRKAASTDAARKALRSWGH